MSNRTRNLTISAMFLAIGQILPFITGQIPAIGAMISPMHYPVFLCGFICGPLYAGLVGFICPLLRSVLFGMPAMYPNAVAMAFELCAYGIITGVVYQGMKDKGLFGVYVTLIVAMIGGRIVWDPSFTMISSKSSNV